MKNDVSRRLLSAIAVVSSVVTFTSAYSQSDNRNGAGEISQKNSLQISFVNETAAYYHCTLSKGLGLKSGISISWNYDEKKDGDGYSRWQEGSSTPIEEKLKSSSSNSSHEIIASSLLTLEIVDVEYISLRLGVGPSLSYSFQKYTSASNTYTDTTYSRNDYSSSNSIFGVGPSVSAIVTTRIYGRVSLVSEWNFSAYYVWNTLNNTSSYAARYPWSPTPTSSQNEEHDESNGWRLRLSSIRVGVLIEL